MAGTIDLTRFIRDVPDFPKPGILFRDITPLLANPQALAAAIAGMAAPWRTERLDAVAAVEARGFLFAVPLALTLGVGSALVISLFVLRGIFAGIFSNLVIN